MSTVDFRASSPCECVAVKDNQKHPTPTEALDVHGRVGPWGSLRAQEPVPTDADLAYMGLTQHQIGLINAIPPGEGQDAVRQIVMSEQTRLLMECDSDHDGFPGRFGDLI